MKIKNKLHLILSALLLSLFIVPANAFAYSNYVISGGNTIGIEVQSKGVLVVGFYKIDDNYVARDAGFMIGDIILEVNTNKVNDINSMINLIEKNVDNNISFKVLRNGKEKNVTMGLLKDSNGVLKTGLYGTISMGVGAIYYLMHLADLTSIYWIFVLFTFGVAWRLVAYYRNWNLPQIHYKD